VGRRTWRGRRGRPGRVVAVAFLIGLFVAASALLLPSCGAADRDGNDPGGFVLTQAGVTVELTVDPYPPKPMQKARFSLAVTNADGDPVTGGSVVCDMTMPAMKMPVNRPAAHETRPGTYTAEVLFTMAGEWQAALTLTPAGGQPLTFTFAVSTR
jgi:hypothetical protein